MTKYFLARARKREGESGAGKTEADSPGDLD